MPQIYCLKMRRIIGEASVTYPITMYFKTFFLPGLTQWFWQLKVQDKCVSETTSKTVIAAYQSYLVVMQSLMRRLDLAKRHLSRRLKEAISAWNYFSWHRQFSKHGAGDTEKRWLAVEGMFFDSKTKGVFLTCRAIAWQYCNLIIFLESWLNFKSPVIIRKTLSNEELRLLSFPQPDCLPEREYMMEKMTHCRLPALKLLFNFK